VNVNWLLFYGIVGFVGLIVVVAWARVLEEEARDDHDKAVTPPSEESGG